MNSSLLTLFQQLRINMCTGPICYIGEPFCAFAKMRAEIVPMYIDWLKTKVYVGVWAFMLLLVTLASPAPSLANSFSLGADYSSDYKVAEPLFTPEPEISPELKEQCFKSCCIAKFLIGANGNTSVQLLSSSGSQEVDEIAIETLRRWKFKPAQLDGRPVESSRKIKVEFEIE
jgi:TonB family protein